MSRTLLVTIDFPPRTGGVARYLGALAGYFGGRVRVVSDPNTLLFRAFWPRWAKTVVFLIRHRISYERVLVSHVLPLGTAAWIAGWFTRRPYVVIVHGLDLSFAKRHPVKRFVSRRVLRRARLVVTNSKALEREIRRDFGITRATTVYPPLAEWARHAAPKVPKELKHGCTFLTVARLVERKGHLRVLEALAKLHAAGRAKGWDYRIIGDGPMLETIRERIKTLGLSDVVHIETEVDDAALAEAYAASDVFVMPTLAGGPDREGFGMVYLEAAAFGVPSIATRQPGVDEAVLHGETGLLVEDGGTGDLEEAMERLANDADLRNKLGIHARNRALKDFSPAVVFSPLETLL